VETDRGLALGTVASAPRRLEDEEATKRGLKSIFRLADADDMEQAAHNARFEKEAYQFCLARIAERELPMNLSAAEYLFDGSKIIFYFTAEGRVDFRELVKDLAAKFRTRIELRQIGARDEAKRLEGVGRCGREYCCSSWLPELRPVSLALAKDQRLSLNPSQISGGCGRLLCCLRYEHEFYVGSRKRFPKEGKTIVTTRGEERVQAVDIFRERVLLRAPDGATRAVTLTQLREELGQAGPGPAPTEPRPPTQLITFDEGSIEVTPERAIEAVAPEGRPTRRRRRRGRRGGRGRTPVERPPQGDGNDGNDRNDWNGGGDG
jgi:cell fate regulator YaaT (PSP1 superfamily)